MKVTVKEVKREYDGVFKVDKAILQHEKFDGTMSKEIARLNFNRGDVVAILLYNRSSKSIILVRQFRYPTYVNNGPGWLLECVAGIKDDGEIAVARKEALEETGYKVDELEYITQFYPSPGGCSEKVYLYLAYVEAKDKINMGVGNEDISVMEVPFSEAFEMVRNGEICDAKTIIGLFFLRDKLEESHFLLNNED